MQNSYSLLILFSAPLRLCGSSRSSFSDASAGVFISLRLLLGIRYGCGKPFFHHPAIRERVAHGYVVTGLLNDFCEWASSGGLRLFHEARVLIGSHVPNR